MLAAIYVRKSTAQTGMSEDARSVERQKTRARAYAASRGWTVADEHVYEDDGISGAEFARRPGYQRLIETLKRLCPFQYLIVMDESRLGRESIETAHVLKQLMVAGVRIFAYLDDREVVLDNLTDKMRLAFTGLMDEGERFRAQQRTFDALHRKALMGHVTGGRVYGYDNIEIQSSVLDAYGRPKRDHVERRINEEQAAVVRQIFRLCAEGEGMVSIARLLNDEGLPAPRNSIGLKISWSPSSVRSLLHRRLYLGEVIWNKTKKRNPWGIQQQRKRSEKDWIKISIPQLQILSEEEWKAAHDRLNTSRALYLRGTKGELWGRRAGKLDSKYLLTGLVKCGVCGGSLFVKSSSRKGQRAFFYGCMTYHLRGRSACQNAMLIPMKAANETVLTVIEQDVLNPQVTDTVVKKALDKFRASQKDKKKNVEQRYERLQRLEIELQRLLAAISAGGDIPTLVEAMKECTERKIALSRDLVDLNRTQALDETDYDELEIELRSHFRRSWEALMSRQVTQTRLILAKLFNGERVPFTPTRSGYEFSGIAAAGKLLIGHAKSVVSPTGFEPVLLP